MCPSRGCGLLSQAVVMNTTLSLGVSGYHRYHLLYVDLYAVYIGYFNTALFPTLPPKVRLLNIVQMATPALEYHVLRQLFSKFLSTRAPFLTSSNFAHPQTIADELLGSINRQNFSNVQINSYFVDHNQY